MAIFSAEERQRISAALNDRGLNRPCPSCGQWASTLVDGYVLHPLYSQAHLTGGSVGDGPPGHASLPCVAVVCNGCGLLTHYTLSGLGLM